MSTTTWYHQITKKHGEIVDLMPISEGYSYDKKYRVSIANGSRFFLRVAEESYALSDRLVGFSICKWIYDHGGPIHKPVEISICDEGLYELYEWIEGQTLSNSTLEDLCENYHYEIGFKAGESLKILHSTPLPLSPDDQVSEYRFLEKAYSVSPDFMRGILQKAPRVRKIFKRIVLNCYCRYVSMADYVKMLKKKLATRSYVRRTYNSYLKIFNSEPKEKNLCFLDTIKSIVQANRMLSNSNHKLAIAHRDYKITSLIISENKCISIIDVTIYSNAIVRDYMEDVADFIFLSYHFPELRRGFILGYLGEPTEDEWLHLKVKLFMKLFSWLNNPGFIRAHSHIDYLKTCLKSMMLNYEGAKLIVPLDYDSGTIKQE